MQKPPILQRLWAWLPPQTWPEIYAVIFTILVAFLAIAYLLHWLKETIPKWLWHLF